MSGPFVLLRLCSHTMYSAVVSTEAEPQIEHAQIARDHFDVSGTAVAIPGYEDHNARIETPAGQRFVLRVSPPEPNIGRIRFVDEAMKAVADASFDAPSSVPTIEGEQFASLPGDRVARLLTWVAGVTADDAGRPPAAARSLGTVAAEMVRLLEPLTPNFRRDDATWDPGRSLDIVTRFHQSVTDEPRHALIDEVLVTMRAIPFDQLPAQVIHSDLNAGNIVLTDNRVSGVIDFEDAARTIRIGELSVACAYAMLVQDDPVSVAMDVIAGYRQVTSVTALEATHLFALALSRLAVSVCAAASLPSGNPHHHHISEITWDLLERLPVGDTRDLAAQFKVAALS